MGASRRARRTGPISWTPLTAGTGVLVSRARRRQRATSRPPAAASRVTVTRSPPGPAPAASGARSTVPGRADAGADSPVELGVKFQLRRRRLRHGVRFYKSAANTGAHVGNLWTQHGTLLAHRDVHRRERRRAGRRRLQLRRWRSSRTRPTSRRTTRRPATTPSTRLLLQLPASTTAASTRSRRRSRPNGVYRYGSDRRVPEPHVSRPRTTGSTSSSTRASTDTTAPRDRDDGSVGRRRVVAPPAQIASTFSEALDRRDRHRHARSSCATRPTRSCRGRGDLRRGGPRARSSTPSAALCLSAVATGRGARRRVGRDRRRGQRAGGRPHVDVHDRRAAPAAARSGTGRADPRRRGSGATRSAATTPRSCAPRA